MTNTNGQTVVGADGFARRTVEIVSPVITCTELELAFCAWQNANDRTDYARSGNAWEAFSAWWDSREWSVYCGNLKTLTFFAWNASHGILELTKMEPYDAERYAKWYQSIEDGRPRSA